MRSCTHKCEIRGTLFDKNENNHTTFQTNTGELINSTENLIPYKNEEIQVTGLSLQRLLNLLY